MKQAPILDLFRVMAYTVLQNIMELEMMICFKPYQCCAIYLQMICR